MPKNMPKFNLLNVLMSLFIIALPAYLYYEADSHAGSDELFLESLLFWNIGLMFVLSKRYSEKITTMFLIDYVCSGFTVIGGEYRSKIYGIGFVVAAIIIDYQWFTYLD